VFTRRAIRRLVSLSLLTGLVGAPPLDLRGETFIWVDAAGTTHFSDDPDSVPNAARTGEAPDVDRLRALWGNDRLGPVPATPRGSSGSREDRVIRLVAGAVDDLGRGETARALAALRSAVRIEPSRPEPYWYLALVDRQRGRYDSATKNLHSFLSTSGPELESWRVSARRRLALLEDERRLADETVARGPLELVAAESPHFRIQMDSELSQVSTDYASTALGYLNDARHQVSQTVGVEPLEPLGVVFYGRAAYSKAYRHRFSFQTVGFFDGRIHVSSPAHPTGELRSLLFHEYTHAVFRDRTGGDRPYWLNEGLAEQIERMARSQPASTRSERASLRRRILAGSWISLRRLAPSFSGLSNEDARAAYLEAVVTVEWIGASTDREQRRKLLERIGEGLSADQALYEAMGLDTDGVDRAVQRQILSEFPEMADDEPQPDARASSS
jgi:hypothetical protein